VNPIKLIPLCILGAACFAPEDKFDDFVEQRRESIGDAGSSQSDAGENGAPLKAEQITGIYLYAVSVALAPSLPTVYLADISAKQVGDQLEVTIKQQPLSKDDWRTPVGPYSEPRVDIVTPTGTYSTSLVISMVPALANAVTSQDSTTETVFTGTFVNPGTPDDPDAKLQFFCGTMTGQATTPFKIPLDGSTFAASRVDNPDDPSSYPRVLIDCNMTPAKGQ